MDVVATPSCSYCGAATSDYLDHLLDLHKFSLAMAREVIGAASAKDSTESITNATGNSKDDSVLTVGGVPIRLPAVSAGGSIHIHIHTGSKDSSTGVDEVQGISVVTRSQGDRISSQKNPAQSSSQLSLEANITPSSGPQAHSKCSGHASQRTIKTDSDTEYGIANTSNSLTAAVTLPPSTTSTTSATKTTTDKVPTMLQELQESDTDTDDEELHI